MNNKLEVIGIDHGWSMMKTISQVFVTGVKEITTTPALFGDVLEYEGKFYKVGTVRQEVKDTKVEDDSFYLLTLAAVAKELKRRGLAEAKVFLAVGLPLTRFGAEKNDFIKYLTKNKRVSFKYENEPYYIEIDDVAVFPQCYAAVGVHCEATIDGYTDFIFLFASKYKLYLPTEEELKAEIETQKAIFYLQQKESEEQELE